MGIIKAAVDSIKGSLADQWVDVIEPAQMSDSTILTKGIKVRVNERWVTKLLR